MISKRRHLPLWALSLSLLGCTHKSQAPLAPPLPQPRRCSVHLVQDSHAKVASREVPAEFWFSLLLDAETKTQQEPYSRLRDCRGERLLPQSFSTSCELEQTLQDREFQANYRLEPHHVVRQAIGPHEELVWVQTQFNERGDAFGPLAKVRWSDSGVDVVAMGTLKAHAHKASLRPHFDKSRRILSVESQRCSDPPVGCTAELRMLSLDERGFHQLPITQSADRCEGESKLVLREEQRVEVSAELSRKIEAIRSVVDTPAGPAIDEQVIVTEELQGADAQSGQQTHSSIKRRDMQIKNGRLVLAPGHWPQILAQYAQD